MGTAGATSDRLTLMRSILFVIVLAACAGDPPAAPVTPATSEAPKPEAPKPEPIATANVAPTAAAAAKAPAPASSASLAAQADAMQMQMLQALSADGGTVQGALNRSDVPPVDLSGAAAKPKPPPKKK